MEWPNRVQTPVLEGRPTLCLNKEVHSTEPLLTMLEWCSLVIKQIEWSPRISAQNGDLALALGIGDQATTTTSAAHGDKKADLL